MFIQTIAFDKPVALEQPVINENIEKSNESLFVLLNANLLEENHQNCCCNAVT